MCVDRSHIADCVFTQPIEVGTPTNTHTHIFMDHGSWNSMIENLRQKKKRPFFKKHFKSKKSFRNLVKQRRKEDFYGARRVTGLPPIIRFLFLHKSKIASFPVLRTFLRTYSTATHTHHHHQQQKHQNMELKIYGHTRIFIFSSALFSFLASITAFYD